MEKGSQAKTLLGIDTGGTFTDFVLCDAGGVRVHKTLSTPDAPERAIVTGLRELGLQPQQAFAMMHGTTVATNAVLQGHGAQTAYITNRGFADILTIGRQTRSELYNLKPAPKTIPVPPELCFEVGGRITPQGEILEDFDDAELDAIKERLAAASVQAVAVNLLFSFIDSRFEERIEQALKGECFVSRASALHPVPGEYERGILTWLNARIAPLMDAYLKKLNSVLPAAAIRVMQSHGYTIASQQASRYSVNLLLSGPAAGVMAVKHLAHSLAEEKVLSFDMGGTSTDVAVIDGDISLTDSGRIGPWPVAVPMIDIRTIGAGGGSIAFVDEAGLLHLGPQSAGSNPGPACYGRGGDKPTVTDANLILGRIPETLQGLALKRDKAAAAFAPLCTALGKDETELASGIIKLANEQMTQALRKTLTSKNCTADEFLLCGFGAAGGLHICALAEGLKIRRAIVPAHAGVLSALGMATAACGLYRTHTVCEALDRIEDSFIAGVQRQLEEQVAAAMQAQQITDFKLRCFAELRYLGQLFCLTLPWQGRAQTAAAFHTAHEKCYGHRLNAPVELVTLRLEARSDPALTFAAMLALFERRHSSDPAGYDATLAPGQHASGPVTIADASCTTWVAQGWDVQRDGAGNLHLQYTR